MKTEKKMIDLIKGKKVIMFGETHGTKKMPKFLAKFIINELKDFDIIVALEIPKEYENKIDEYFKEGKGKWSFATKDYYNLIKRLKSNNIKIAFIDGYITSQEEKEENLAKEILNINKNNEKIIVITGDIHASPFPINVDGLNIKTTGSILKKVLKDDLANVRLVLNDDGDKFNNNFEAVINCNNGILLKNIK